MIRVEYKEDLCKNSKVGLTTEEGKPLETDVVLFPNPVNNLLTLDVEKTFTVTKVEVFDVHGKMVIQNTVPDQKGKIVLATEGLQPGMYIVKLRTQNGETRMMKFLKK